MKTAAWVLLLSMTAIAAVGCHTHAVPLLGTGPFRVDDPGVYDDALVASRRAGHPAIRVDPDHGRFAVRAQSDPMRQTVFIVQCSRDGFVTVTPTGGRVVRTRDTFVVPPALRTEWTNLVWALEHAIPESR